MYGFGFLLFVLHIICGVSMYILWLRCLLQKRGVSGQNVVMGWVFRVTQPVVRWFQVFCPLWRGWDLGVVAPLCVVGLIEATLMWLLIGLHQVAGVIILLWAVLLLVSRLVEFYFIVVLMAALIGWFPLFRGSPVYHVLKMLSDPLLQPIRRILPRTGRFDWSPLIVLLVLKVIEIFVLSPWLPI